MADPAGRIVRNTAKQRSENLANPVVVELVVKIEIYQIIFIARFTIYALF